MSRPLPTVRIINQQKRHLGSRADQKRNLAIAKAYLAGATTIELGRRFGVTHQRIQQITTGLGVNYADTARAARVRQQKRAQAEKRHTRERQVFERTGLTWAQYQRTLSWRDARGRRLVRQYLIARQSALRRRISWGLNFKSWFAVWSRSTHIDQMGTRAGEYMLTRKSFRCGYSPANAVVMEVTLAHCSYTRAAPKVPAKKDYKVGKGKHDVVGK